MAFGDQIYRQTNLTENTMKVDTILNDFVSDVTPNMHQVRRNCLKSVLRSLLYGADLTVTSLGRNISSFTSEKHQIKRSARLLGNHHLHFELTSIYRELSLKLVQDTSRPIILVDWSDLDERHANFLLRASIAVDGRSLTLLEEIHPLKRKEKPEIHRLFIHKLLDILPNHCKPIIVTDAGFRNPWFKLIRSIGWDFLGRVRQRTHCKRLSDSTWYPNKNLHSQAKLKANHLGHFELCKRNSIECEMVIVNNKLKGRKDLTAKGDRARSSGHSRTHALGRREPWLIATSLFSKQQGFAKKVISIYSTRMQIEESFRDLKTGFGFTLSQTRKRPHLRVLLMLANLAQYVLFLIGILAVNAGRHLSYQANSIKTYRVLSFQFVGLRVLKDQQFKFSKKDFTTSKKSLSKLIEKNSVL